MDRPDEEDMMKKTQETQAALEKIINGKLTAIKVARPDMNQNKQAEYIRYQNTCFRGAKVQMLTHLVLFSDTSPRKQADRQTAAPRSASSKCTKCRSTRWSPPTPLIQPS
jgi:hypothetical protein